MLLITPLKTTHYGSYEKQTRIIANNELAFREHIVMKIREGTSNSWNKTDPPFPLETRLKEYSWTAGMLTLAKYCFAPNCLINAYENFALMFQALGRFNIPDV